MRSSGPAPPNNTSRFEASQLRKVIQLSIRISSLNGDVLNLPRSPTCPRLIRMVQGMQVESEQPAFKQAYPADFG
jgi:hypothetical protein